MDNDTDSLRQRSAVITQADKLGVSPAGLERIQSLSKDIEDIGDVLNAITTDTSDADCELGRRINSLAERLEYAIQQTNIAIAAEVRMRADLDAMKTDTLMAVNYTVDKNAALEAMIVALKADIEERFAATAHCIADHDHFAGRGVITKSK